MYLYKMNSLFVEGARSHLTNKPEVMANLRHQLNLHSELNTKVNRLTRVVGFILLTLSIAILLLYIYFFFTEYIHVLTPVTLLMTLGGMSVTIFPIVKSSIYILNPHLILKCNQYVESIYGLLLKKGSVKSGHILSVDELLFNKRRIRYMISESAIEGDYFTSQKDSFVEGETVHILYLNEITHVLL